MGRFIPRGYLRRGGCPMTARLVLWTCCLLALAPVGIFAQEAPDSIRTFYRNYRTLRIPFRDLDPRVVEVLLYVSTDGQKYNYNATARPTEQGFYFQAPSDGCYSFIVQTRDSANVLTPPDFQNVQPSMRICIDTERPRIERLEQSPGGYPSIQWSIADANFAEVWADYHSTRGGDWYPLLLPSKSTGAFSWKSAIPGDLEVRLQAKDKAGNTSEPKTIVLRIENTVAGMPPPPDPGGPSNIMHVSTRTFDLHYELGEQGPSGVAKVEAWKIRPGGAWQKCEQAGDATRQTIRMTVESSGRWGFRLIPRNGVGLAQRDPQPNDPPDIWVEVDERRPDVRITNVTVTPTVEGGLLTIYWTANDTFLKATPITILQAAKPDGPWVPLSDDSRNLPNSGSWAHKTEDLKLLGNFQCYLKVLAADEAGNVGSDVWKNVVKVDLKIPTIKKIEVKPSESTPGDGQQTNATLPQTSQFSVTPVPPQPVSNPHPSPPSGSTGMNWSNPEKGKQ